MRALSAVAIGLLAVPLELAAQNQLQMPGGSCNISAGHFRVSSAVVYYKTAYEKPAQRDRMLAQMVDVLTRAITGDQQDQNPAAWYYLGRYYVEKGDARGADSAFARAEKLAPQCAQDIAGYRSQLYTNAVNEGLRTWQENKLDSALLTLQLAHHLLPAHPKALFSIGAVYAAKDDLDSAAAYLREGVRAAGTDTAYAAEKKDALSTIARSFLHHTQTDPAAQQWQRTRYTKDSLAQAIAYDSVVLERVDERSASRRARGARLSPADQRTFASDSAARAQALAQGRAQRIALAPRVAAESAAVAGVYGPAILAFGEYVKAYPTDFEGVTTLSSLYLQAGRIADANNAFDGYLSHADAIDPDLLFQAGAWLAARRLGTAAVKAYTLGLQRNPWNRPALFDLTKEYVGRRDSTNATAMASQLVELDPLNRDALRLAASAWDLRGRRDSSHKYHVLADSTLSVDVSVGSFIPDSSGYVVTGVATNLRQTSSTPFHLTFEFLDALGAPRATQATDIPALPPGGNQQFEIRVTGKGILGWRYRRG